MGSEHFPSNPYDGFPGDAGGGTTSQALASVGRENSSSAGRLGEAIEQGHGPGPLGGPPEGGGSKHQRGVGPSASFAHHVLATRAMAMAGAQAQAHGRASHSHSEGHSPSVLSAASSHLTGINLPPPSDLPSQMLLRYYSESQSQSQPQPQPQLGNDLPGALAQLLQGNLNQQAQLNMQGPMNQQGQLRQSLLARASASAAATFTGSDSPSFARNAAATVGASLGSYGDKALGTGAGAGAGPGGLAGGASSSSSSSSAALAELLAASPSLRALLRAFEPVEAGDSHHGASYAEAVAGAAAGEGEGVGAGVVAGVEAGAGARAGEGDGAGAGAGSSHRGGANQRGDVVPSALRQGGGAGLPRSPGRRSPVACFELPSLPETRQDAALGGLPALDMGIPFEEAMGGPTDSHLKDTLESAVLGLMGPALEGQGREQSSPVPWERNAQGQGTGAYGARRTGEAENTETSAPEGPRPGVLLKQERSSGLRVASPLEELEGDGGDSQGTPTEGKLNTKSVVEKRRRERISNAFTDLRKEMDIHGDMATVLVEATKLVKKQKVLIQNLQKQVYIHQMLKSNHRLF